MNTSTLQLLTTLALTISLTGAAASAGGLTVSIDPPGPQPVGTEVTLSVTGDTHDPVDFRLLVRKPGGELRVVYDFSPRTHQDWIIKLAYQLDEAGLHATLSTSIDTGYYSAALGSAQLLENGNFHLDNGMVSPPPLAEGVATEHAPNGIQSHAVSANTMIYRSFRMRDLYSSSP